MNIAMAFAFSLAIGPAQQATPAPVQAPSDPRWAPWFGCWQRDDGEGVSGTSRLCIVPEGAGVRLLTFDGDLPSTDEPVIADGVSRPIRDAECAGTEAVEWSRTKSRVFRRAELSCGGAARSLASLWFPTRGRSWVEVLAVDARGSRNVRVRYYGPSPDQRLPDGITLPRVSQRAATASWGASDAVWNVDDVIEASAKMPADVVQAALVQLDGPVPLSAKALVAMDDAGVAESVIDLMVALAHPRRFEVQRASGGSGGGFGEWSESGDSIFWSMWPAAGLFGISPYYWGWGGCSAFYGCGGYYPYYPGDGWVVIPPGPSGSAPAEARAVNGLGYTRVSVRAPEPTPHVAGSSGGGSGDSGASSGTGSQASPGGYSGGSSGGGERTAQPRGPGGE